MKISQGVKTIFVGSFLMSTAMQTGRAMGNTYQSQKNPDNVSLVTAFSGSDALQFQELGPVSCEITNKKITAVVSGASSPEEACRRDLRIHGARMGADIVLIEETRRIACEDPKPDIDCAFMKGRAYARRSQPSSDPSAKVVPPTPPAAPAAASSNPGPVQHARHHFAVSIVPALSAEQLSHYKSVGTVECSRNIYMNINETHEKQCRDEVQYEAFKKGADVVAIDSQEVIPCINKQSPHSKDEGPCLKMTATGYRIAD